MVNDFLMCFGLSDCELIFISDFVEIPLVSVMEMTQVFFCFFFFIDSAKNWAGTKVFTY